MHRNTQSVSNEIIFVFFVLIFCVNVNAINCSMQVTPSDIEINSSGDIEVLYTCSGNNLNHSSMFITITLDGGIYPGLPNLYSFRVPSNANASSYGIVTENILRGHNRNINRFFEYQGLFNDYFSYSVYDVPSGNVKLTSGAGWAQLNMSWIIEYTVFRQMYYLKRGWMEAENKTNQNYDIYSNHAILFKGWDLEHIRGVLNYTFFDFYNMDYEGNPNKDIVVYYCLESYDINGGISPNNDNINCQYRSSYNINDINNKIYSSKNSSYFSSGAVGINEGCYAGLNITNHFYTYIMSDVSYPNRYIFRYSKNENPSNTSFNESNIAWITSNNGINFIQANFTPDTSHISIDTGNIISYGGYIQNNSNHNYTNFSMYMDEIGEGNFPISKPSILYLCQDFGNICTNGKNYNLNGSYHNNLAFHIGLSIDPDNVNSVKHNLYLCNTDGSINYTISSNFYQINGAQIHIDFNTIEVNNATYKINITAIADDDLNDKQSFLSVNNFTIIRKDNFYYFGDSQLCIKKINGSLDCLLKDDSTTLNNSHDYFLILKNIEQNKTPLFLIDFTHSNLKEVTPIIIIVLIILMFFVLFIKYNT